MNSLNVFSLTVIFLNIYLGLFYLSGASNGYDNIIVVWLFQFIVIVPNFAFFVELTRRVYLKLLVYFANNNFSIWRLMTFGLVKFSDFAQKYLKGKDAAGDTETLEESVESSDSVQSQKKVPSFTDGLHS